MASQNGTSGAAAPVTVVYCVWAPLGAQLWGEHNLCNRSCDCHSTEEELREVQTPAQSHAAGRGNSRTPALPRISHSPPRLPAAGALEISSTEALRLPGLSFSLCTVRWLMWLSDFPHQNLLGVVSNTEAWAPPRFFVFFY